MVRDSLLCLKVGVVGLLLCCDRHVFAGSDSDDEEEAESMAEDQAAFRDEGTFPLHSGAAMFVLASTGHMTLTYNTCRHG